MIATILGAMTEKASKVARLASTNRITFWKR
jgi:hypothetical protein